MPDAGIQARPYPLTPPQTPPPRRTKGPPSPGYSPMMASVSSLDSLDSMDNRPVRKPQRLRNPSRRALIPPIHLHLGTLHIAAAPPKQAATCDTGVQAGECCLPQSDPNGYVARAQRYFAVAKPYLRWLTVVPLFFLDRVGFGVNLTSLIAPGR